MTMNFQTVAALGLAAICVAGLAAQTQETKTTTTTNTKVEIKGGKDITAIGCLAQRSNGDYFLNSVHENRTSEPAQYALVTTDDLSRHVGERVEIQGKAVEAGHGKISVESKTTTEVENGKDRESKVKSEGTIGAFDMPYLGVKSMKTLSSTCS